MIPFFCFGQQQGNIWYFGQNAGLDFNSGIPVNINDGQTYVVGCIACHSEGTSVMSDSSGSLLFYSNGQQIWNRDHQIMPNGNYLLSNASATQGSLIVPKPGSSRYYYVFTVDDFNLDNLQYGFRYSIVDICLDNGLGDVIPGQKNILLLDTVAEKLTGVRHANGTDYWIIVHKYYSNAFVSYQLSSSGIINSVVSFVGSVHPTGSIATGGAIGQLKASPNGQKLVIVNGNTNFNIAEYFDFDPNTGIISNAVSIQFNPLWNYYGASFSPDNSKLYIACMLNGNGIYQFDMNAGGGDPASVIASVELIAGYYNYLGLQLAIDGKIYVARAPFSGYPFLGVINNPNAPGDSCNFVDSAIDLNGNSASYGFPNFIDSYDYSTTISDCHIGIDEDVWSEKVLIAPNPFGTETTLKSNKYLNNATLTIYNSFGVHVKEIENISGYTYTFQRTDLPNGLYVVRLIQDNKMIFTDQLVITTDN